MTIKMTIDSPDDEVRLLYMIGRVTQDGVNAIGFYDDAPFLALPEEQQARVAVNAAAICGHPEIDARALHALFCAAMKNTGPADGVPEDQRATTHIALVPWEALPAAGRAYFHLYVALVNAFRGEPVALPPLGEDFDETIVAKVAHEVNRTWCLLVGDSSAAPWHEAPAWQTDSSLRGVRYLRANPGAGQKALHDAWMADKLAEAWTYGPEKDPELKRHPCLLPYEALPFEQLFKDTLFEAVVRGLSA